MKIVFDRLRSEGVKRWALQSLFIIVAVLSSIFTVTWVLEKSLVREAMEMEAEAFIGSYSTDASFPLPRTRNLIGYMSSGPEHNESIPDALLGLTAGLHNSVDIPGQENPVPVYVRDFASNRLYLVFNGANIDRLVGIFGLLPLTVMLILIYVGSWIAYRVTWRAVSPVLQIARNLRETAPDAPSFDIPLSELSGDARELAAAIEDYRRRNEALIERERQFTADVSHELRTPVTIIDGAAQFLAGEEHLSAKGAERVHMIRRASRDVNELITAFLLLAREQSGVAQAGTGPVAEIIRSEVEKLAPLLINSKVKIELNIQEDFTVDAPRKALEIIFGNVLRNAANYTEQGQITVIVTDNRVVVDDTGIGIPEDILPNLFERHVRGRGLQQAGEGIGLAIVKRLCDQFGWQIDIRNKQENGVCVTLTR